MGKQFTVSKQIDAPGVPSSRMYQVGATVTVTDAQYARLSATVLAALSGVSTVADPAPPEDSASSYADAILAAQHTADKGAYVPVLVATSRGVVGDGTTDNTTAIQALIATAAASGASAIYFPPGVYVTGPLTVPPGVTLQGLTSQTYYNATSTVPNLNTQSQLVLKTGSTGALLSPDDTGTNKATAVSIRDLALNCNNVTPSAGAAGVAINLPDQGSSISRFWLLERVYAFNSGGTRGHTVYVGNQNTAVTMRDVVIFNGTSGSPGGWNGLGWYGSDGRADNCYIGYCANVGLNLFGGTADETFTWRGGGIFTSGGANVACGGGGSVFEGSSIDHGITDGVFINNGPVTFLGCTFHDNSASGVGNNADIHVAGNNVDVTVIGCRTAPGSTTPKNFINVTGTGVTLRQFGNSNEAAIAYTNGWTNYSPTAAQSDATIADLGVGQSLASSNGLGTLPTGAIIETISRKMLSSAAVNGGSGTMRGALVHLQKNTVITSLTWQAGTTALSAGTHQWFAVCDTTGKILAVTADDTSTAWAASTAKTLPLTSPLTIPATGGYYLCHCVVATTIPTHFGAVATVPSLVPFVAAAATGQTTPPAVGSTLTLTSSSNVDYGYAT